MTDLQTLARGVVAAGFDGERLDEALPPWAGYLLFARNCRDVAQVRSLTDALGRMHGDAVAPPLIAIDQEGGRVLRLRAGVEEFPPMMAFGAVADPVLARRAGEQLGFDLRRAGCTLDFAPVLDLALEAQNAVIGTRSFGANPARVLALGAAFASGLARAGIIACYKHFPGHGATATDSHVALPYVDASLETLRARDLVPFASVAPAAPAIMGTHCVVRALDPDRPATLSRAVIEDLLRGELGFRGAYVTDCLEMGAIAGAPGTVPAALEAIRAGADLLLVSHSPATAEAIVAALCDAVANGTLARERLAQAYERVLALRAAGAPPLPLDAPPPHPGVAREAARRAVTLVRGTAHVDPTAACAISFGDPHRLEREAPALLTVALSAQSPGTAEIAHLWSVLDASKRRPLLLLRAAHRHPAQAATAREIVARYPDAVVVSTHEPFDVASVPNARHLLACYGDDAASMGGLADVLFGGSMPEGVLPVEISVGV